MPSVTLVGLSLTQVASTLNPGDATSLVLNGIFSDGSTFALPTSGVTFATNNSSIVQVGSNGAIAAIADGTTVVTATYNGLEAGTAVTVGPLPTVGTLQFFPTSYTLQPGGQTRQFIVDELQPDGTVIDRSSAASGTIYILSNASLGTITADGLFTSGSSAGTGFVAVIYKGRTQVVPISIVVPVTGPTVVSTAGGATQDTSGDVLDIPAGALGANATVSITSLTQSQLGLGMPDGFTFDNAFTVNLGGNALATPAAISIPAPAGSNVGDVIYLFRKAKLLVDTNTYIDAWEVVDDLVVHADGRAYSASPPFPGDGTDGQFVTGSAQNLALVNISLNSPGQSIQEDPKTGVAYFVVSNGLFQIQIPILPKGNVTLFARRSNPQGFVNTTPVNVQLNANQANQVLHLGVSINEPTPTDTSPHVTSLSFDFEQVGGGQYAPVLTIDGFNLDSIPGTDTFVNFFNENEVPAGLQTIPPVYLARSVKITPFKQSATELKVIIPQSVPIASSTFQVTRTADQLVQVAGQNPMEVPTPLPGAVDAIHLKPQSLVVAVNSAAGATGNGTVSIIGTATGTPGVIAQITVGQGATNVAVSPDGRYAYVTNTNEGTISIIDLITLQEVNLDPTGNTFQRIDTPGGHPFYIALSADGKIGMATDRDTGVVWQFDADPTDHGTRYAQPYTIATGITGLTGITFNPTSGDALSPEGQYVYIASPFHNSWAGTDNVPGVGYVYVYNYITHQVVAQIRTGAKPIGVTATSDPDKIAVAVRGSEATGYTLINNTIFGNANGFKITTVPTNLRGTEPVDTTANVFANTVSNGVSQLSTLFDINSAEKIVYTDDNQYAFVVFHNSFELGDASRDPSFASGSNIGILADPLGLTAQGPHWVGATKEMPFGFADDITIDPTNQFVMATYTGLNRIVAYNISEIEAAINILAVYNPSAISKPSKPIEDYIAELIGTDPLTYLKTYRPNTFGVATNGNQAALNVAATANLTALIVALKQGNLLTTIAAGGLPWGIASGPALPTDLVAIGANDTPSTNGGPDTITLTYTITGSSSKPFYVSVSESPSNQLGVNSPFVDETYISNPKDLSVGYHVYSWKVTPGLKTVQDFYVIDLDSHNQIAEPDETNNTASFVLPPVGLSDLFKTQSKTDPSQFGTYIRGVSVNDKFTITFDPIFASQVVTAKILLNGLPVTPIPQGVGTGIFQFIVDLGVKLKVGANTLTIEGDDASGNDVTGTPKTFTLNSIAQPDWLAGTTDPFGKPVTSNITYDATNDDYHIVRDDYMIDATTTLPKSIPFIGGGTFGEKLGIELAFDFGFNGVAQNQKVTGISDTVLDGHEVKKTFPVPTGVDLNVPIDKLSTDVVKQYNLGTTQKTLSAVDLSNPNSEPSYTITKGKFNPKLYLENGNLDRLKADGPAGLTGTSSSTGTTGAINPLSLAPAISGVFTPYTIDPDLTLEAGNGLNFTVQFQPSYEFSYETLLAAGLIGPIPADARFALTAALQGQIQLVMNYEPVANKLGKGLTLGGTYSVTAGLQVDLTARISANLLFGAASIAVSLDGAIGLKFTALSSKPGPVVPMVPANLSATVYAGVNVPFKAALPLKVIPGAGGVLGFIGYKPIFNVNILRSDDLLTPGKTVHQEINGPLNKYLSQPPAQPGASLNASAGDSASGITVNIPATGVNPALVASTSPVTDASPAGAMDLGGVQATTSINETLTSESDSHYVHFNLVAFNPRGAANVTLNTPDLADGVTIALYDDDLAYISTAFVNNGVATLNLADLTAGGYYVKVTTDSDSQGSIPYTLSVTGNTTTLGDLTARISTPNKIIYPGQLAPLTYTITNVGASHRRDHRAHRLEYGQHSHRQHAQRRWIAEHPGASAGTDLHTNHFRHGADRHYRCRLLRNPRRSQQHFGRKQQSR